MTDDRRGKTNITIAAAMMSARIEGMNSSI